MTEDRRKPEWHFRDLVTDHHTGKLRETLLWSNIGKSIAAWALIHNVLKGTDSEWLWLVIMCVLVFHELASRLISTYAPDIIAKRFGITKTVDTHSEVTTGVAPKFSQS